MFDPEKFGEAMGAAIREAVAPLQKRIGELEAQLSKTDDVKQEVERAVALAVAKIPVPKDGRDGEPVDAEDLIKTVIAQIPMPAAGKDGERGADGTSITVDDVRPLLEEAIAGVRADATKAIDDAVKALPVPQDGRDGKDGADGMSVTLDDVSGLLDMAVNKWALEFERRAQDTMQKAVDRIPTPKDGKDGKDGIDGVGFDDLQVEYDGERGVTLKFVRGEVTKEALITIPVVLDRGIFKEGQSYETGDGVTWGGSFWIAQSKTAAKPDSGEGWRLAVKRGRDGKDGRDGIDKTAPVKL